MQWCVCHTVFTHTHTMNLPYQLIFDQYHLNICVSCKEGICLLLKRKSWTKYYISLWLSWTFLVGKGMLYFPDVTGSPLSLCVAQSARCWREGDKVSLIPFNDNPYYVLHPLLGIVSRVALDKMSLRADPNSYLWLSRINILLLSRSQHITHPKQASKGKMQMFSCLEPLIVIFYLI